MALGFVRPCAAALTGWAEPFHSNLLNANADVCGGVGGGVGERRRSMVSSISADPSGAEATE
jgi:hypothetical protein